MKIEFDNPDVFGVLLDVCFRHKIDPQASIEAEDFYRNLLSSYEGEPDLDKFAEWLDNKIRSLYHSFGKKPEWIQSENWPIDFSKPMIFVGQITVSRTGFFHDTTSFYVFWGSETGNTKVIVQTY